MIKKKKNVNYPYWGEKTIEYDSFVLKVVDEDTNEVFTEFWAKTEDEFAKIQEHFNNIKETSNIFETKIIEYNIHCFEYFMFANDELGAIKIKDSKNGKSQHRILAYIQGFLSEKQN